MNFQSKVALITGRAKGIGKAIAKGFLAGGRTCRASCAERDALTEAATEPDPSGEKGGDCRRWYWHRIATLVWRIRKRAHP